MSAGAKQLGAIVIAVVCAVALVGISATMLGSDGIVKTALDDQIGALTTAGGHGSETPGGGYAG